METLYPMFYGTRMVTLDVLKATFEPHMHPEAARRAFAFIVDQGGLFGIGSGYRPPGTQPSRVGFAPPGKSFHEGQPFPSGQYYVAWDMVVVNPGNKHRSPRLDEVPRQGSDVAFKYGWHMNIDSEPWHAQPVELDGWGAWDRAGRPDLLTGYLIDNEQQEIPVEPEPVPAPPIEVPVPVETPPVEVPVPVEPPPTEVPPPQPTTQGITVEFTSRNLLEGNVGNDVKFFQKLLNDIAGQGLDLDGNFGPKTTQGVKNWQTFFGLTSDGILGPKTQRSIIEIALQT